MTWIIRIALAPLLSAHFTTEPASSPFEIFGACPSMPLAIRPRPLAFAATLILSYFFNHYKRDSFADWAALGYPNFFVFLHIEAWWIVRAYVAVSPFVAFEFRHVKLIITTHDDGFVHFGAYDYSV
jgi:hypothetical protein